MVWKRYECSECGSKSDYSLPDMTTNPDECISCHATGDSLSRVYHGQTFSIGGSSSSGKHSGPVSAREVLEHHRDHFHKLANETGRNPSGVWTVGPGPTADGGIATFVETVDEEGDIERATLVRTRPMQADKGKVN